MDHQTFAQLLGNYGEFVGAIAVVVTLAYLTTQVRQSAKAVRSSTQESFRASVSSLIDFVAEYSDVFCKVDLGKPIEDITPKEFTIYRAYFFKLMNVNESAFIYFQEGTLSKEVFEARMQGFAPIVRDQQIRELWEQYKDFGFTLRFIEYVDNVLLAPAT